MVGAFLLLFDTFKGFDAFWKLLYRKKRRAMDLLKNVEQKDEENEKKSTIFEQVVKI